MRRPVRGVDMFREPDGRACVCFWRWPGEFRYYTGSEFSRERLAVIMEEAMFRNSVILTPWITGDLVGWKAMRNEA